MFYELREYTATPGYMPKLVERFKKYTMDLFEKHSMKVTFIALTDFGEDSVNELVYVLEFDSYEQCQTQWTKFRADPEWQEIRRQSEVDGPLLVSLRRRLLSSTAFTA